MSAYLDINDGGPEVRERAIAEAVATIQAGDLLVMPTDTVYGIAADAFNPAAVTDLLSAKGRGRLMPPPVLVPDVRTVDGLASDVLDDARLLMNAFWPGGLTLIMWAQPSLQWDLGDTGGTVALRMPDHPVALDILALTGPLAVSSANLTGLAAALTAAQAQAQLGDSVSVYVEAGEATAPTASTIVDCTGSVFRVLRPGAISVDRLREVVPVIMDEFGNVPAGVELPPEALPDAHTATDPAQNHGAAGSSAMNNPGATPGERTPG